MTKSDYFAAANSIIDGLINKNGARADESAFSDLSDKISLDPHYAAIASRGDPDDIGRW
jgi:hypothetical protein